ncbi:hypothetical protein K3495_g13035 [Podosphaera aphanis]|nr:hypothetical protein K3495_g13035 [Podosphaera aphanis]
MEIDSASSYQMEHATHDIKNKSSTPSDDSKNITCDQNYGILNDTDDTDIQDLKDETDKARDVDRYLFWHRRCAHLRPDKISNLHDVTTLKKQIKIPRNLDVCEVCALTKMRHRIPKYFHLIKETSTRRDWVYTLANKAEAYNSVHKWKKMIELQLNKKVKAAGCDNAPELIKAIREWNAKDGVTMGLTTIAASHQNGPVERIIQTVNTDSRAMIKDAELPLEFWDEAAEADRYMRNRTACGPRINGKRISPLEAFIGKIPEIDHIRRWGSKCYYFVDRKSISATEKKGKLVNLARVGVFMGYSETTTSHFKVYSRERGCTIEVSILKVDKKINGGTIDLKIRSSSVGPQGTKNEMNDRKPRGRPKNTIFSPTEKFTLSRDHLSKPMQEPSHESDTRLKAANSESTQDPNLDVLPDRDDQESQKDSEVTISGPPSIKPDAKVKPEEIDNTYMYSSVQNCPARSQILILLMITSQHEL